MADPLDIWLNIGENFAGSHRNETHRRAWLATIDHALLADLVSRDDDWLQMFDNAVADACAQLGYEEPRDG